MGTNTFSLSARMHRSALLRYILAAAAVLIALVVSAALRNLGGDSAVYVLLLPAVAFSAWFCGKGPSILAIGMALAGGSYGPLTSLHAFAVPTLAQFVLLITFFCSSLVLLGLAESRRRQNEMLLQEQGELESRVQKRTADLDAANQNLRNLSARLLQLQDDERRRIARELHDSVGQMLAALNMNLSTVRGDIERLTKTANALADSENLVHEMTSEVRTISHLLHPPLLDEAGLSSALRWYVDGFALRSKIRVDLDLPEDFRRLPRESETAIFRVVQECLTNIHRHSGSPIAKIRLRQREREVLVEIADKGKGIPSDKQEEMSSEGTPGVGIRGMRERLRQLGGSLDIDSNNTGTLVVVRLPVGENLSSPSSVEVTDPSPAAA
ncbi:MAG TPA: sensor histidine kinase [Candidatus Sulfotelmatobacter sp.]|nr:sensor histidine kinase [Candidatus Sulfotelmatobacter sp.]